MEDLEWPRQAGELAGPEEMIVARGTPPEVALRGQEGLHDEHAARGDARTDFLHAHAVKIVEHENRLKDAERRQFALQIGGNEVGGDAQTTRGLGGGRERVGVAVDPRDARAEQGRRDRVAAGAAGYVQHRGTRTHVMSMPGEPGAGARERGGRGGHGLRATIAELVAEPHDLLVIGGGINGAGIARDAAMRGLRTALVERHDLASGTSSKSSRLIHGGVRYLEHGHLRLVFEACAERAVLLRIAPHLVRPLPFVLPVYRSARVPRWKVAAGMWLYDLLAGFRNVRRHRMLGKQELLGEEPTLRARDLEGGARYFDAQCDDARLVVATARSAAAHGARIATYTRLVSFVRDGDRAVAAEVEDLATGERALVRATVILNATGPWSDAVRQLEAPDAPRAVRCTKGVHIVVPRSRIGHTDAVTFLSPIDGRVMFALPWGEWSYVGTTDTDYADAADDVTTTADDVTYLLRSANACFPGAHLTPSDVVATWAGLRPLLDTGDADPDSVSREHRIDVGPAGVLHVAGGKLTTYRRMSAEAVDRACALLKKRGVKPPKGAAATDVEPLPGGDAFDLSPLRPLGRDAGLADATIDHLLKQYGTEAAAIFNLARGDRALAAPLHPEHPAIGAEVVHAARREFAERVEDVLVRRTHLYYETPDQGVAAAVRTAELLGAELGWDEGSLRDEAARYVALVAREAARRA